MGTMQFPHLLKDLSEGQKRLEEEVSGIKTTLTENVEVTKAIRHNLEVANAKIDRLFLDSVITQAVKMLDAKVEVLVKELLKLKNRKA